MVCSAGCLSLNVALLVFVLFAKFSSGAPQASRPIHAAVSLFFKDLDENEHRVHGEVVWRRATDESDVTSYALYWGVEEQDSSHEKLDANPIHVRAAQAQGGEPSCSDGSYRRRQPWFEGKHRRRRTPQCDRIEMVSQEQSSWYIARSRSSYDNRENAKIFVEGPGTIEVISFVTEENHDTLAIGTLTLSGNLNTPFSVELPSGVHKIKWKTDESVTRTGWELMFRPQIENGEYLTFAMPITTIPQVQNMKATHLLLFSANAHGEMSTGVHFPILDNVTLLPPTGLALNDSDARRGVLSGDLVFSMTGHAAAHHVDVFWGGDYMRVLGPCNGVAGYMFEWSTDDCSGHHHHLTTMSAPFAPARRPGMNASMFSQGMVFDGNLIAKAESSWRLKLHNFTIMAWVNPQSISQDDVRLVGKGTARNNYGVFLVNGGTVKCTVDGTCGHEQNTKYLPLSMPGHSYSTEDNTQKCQARCGRTSSCAYFSFDSSDNRCYLHNSGALRTHGAHYSTWTAGPKRCNSAPPCHSQDLISIGTWSHVACTYDGASIRVYVNSALKMQCDWVGIPEINDDPLTLGGVEAESTKFDGIMDEVHVNDRALSDLEIHSYSNSARVASVPLSTSQVAQDRRLEACGMSWNGYRLALSGAGSCSTCGEPVLTYAECALAAAEGAHFLGIGPLGARENWGGTPGCHIQEGSNFQWNDNFNGGSAPGHTPVCKFVAQPLPQAVLSNASVPAGATHLLAFSTRDFYGRGDGGSYQKLGSWDASYAVALSVSSVDKVVPTHKPREIFFQDSNPAEGIVSGCAFIKGAEQEDSITHYTLYWGTNVSKSPNATHPFFYVPKRAASFRPKTLGGRTEGPCTTLPGTSILMHKLDAINGSSLQRQEECRERCRAFEEPGRSIYGCELVHTGWEKGCYAHMNYVRGTNVAGTSRYCWAVPSHRLTSNPSGDLAGASEGRLEVFNGYTWGTVCDAGFDDTDADVACRHMGYASGSAQLGSYVDTNSTQPIHLSGLPCEGAEGNLFDCVSDESQQMGSMSGCSHSRDVGVSCTGTLDSTSAGPVDLMVAMLPMSAPAGTHIVVLSAYSTWELEDVASTPVMDYAPPMVRAGHVTFTDTDLSTGRVAGVVNISHAVSTNPACGMLWNGYILAATGTQSCGGCGSTVLTYEDCALASAGGALVLGIGALGGRENWLGTPGCHIQDGANFQWNDNSAGVASPGHTPVCKYNGPQVFQYNVYWADSNNSRLTGLPALGFIPHNVQGQTIFHIPMGTDMPAGATQITVFAEGLQNGTASEALTGTSVTVTDWNMQRVPRELSFVDQDNIANKFGGLVTVMRALLEDNITAYSIWWGTGEAESASATELSQWRSVAKNPPVQNIVVKMMDSYGDGWNGVRYTLKKAGTTIGTGTLDSGSSSYDTVPDLQAGEAYTISVGGGSYQSEVSWQVRLGSDTGQILVEGRRRVDAIRENVLFQIPGAGSDGIVYAPDSITVPMPAGTMPISGATHLLVFGASGGQQGQRYGASVLLDDMAPPQVVAQSVMFNDTNSLVNNVSGFVRIERAADDTQVTHYMVYWGQSSTQKLGVEREPGLKAEFFYFRQGDSIPELDRRSPDLVRVDSQVDYSNTGSHWTGLGVKDHYVSRWTGHVQIITAGDYTFKIGSDDGSKLFINGALLVENDGRHALRWRSATQTLSTGFHALRLMYFENTGHAGMQLHYQGPDTGGVEVTIDASKLWHGYVDQAYIGNASIAGASGQWLEVPVPTTAIPNAATHLLVFSASDGGENPNGTSTNISDYGVPQSTATAINFEDLDPASGVFGGVLTVMRASSEFDITHYSVYWGTTAFSKIAYQAAVATFHCNSTTTATTTATTSAMTTATTTATPTYFHLSVGSLSPPTSQATHLVVISGYGENEMQYGVGVALSDYAPIQYAAANVSFTDVDGTMGELGGNISIHAPDDETGFWGYRAYWGRNASERLEGGIPGFFAEFFWWPRTLSRLPDDLDQRSPDLTRTDFAVNYAINRPGGGNSHWPGLNRRDLFVCRWTGRLQILKAGLYRFHIESDDGSRLKIDGELVVDNDMLHGNRWRQGNAQLSSGSHDIVLTHFENRGGASMVFKYRGADTGNIWVIVPSTAVRYGAVARPPIGTAEKNGGVTTVSLARDTSIPAGGTHFLVYAIASANATAEQESMAFRAAAATDIVMPEHAAEGLELSDTDQRQGMIDGVLTITRASVETQITNYRIYWGSSSSQKIADLAPIGSVTPTTSSDFRVWTLSNKAWLDMQGRACSQSSTAYSGTCDKGIDGNSDSDYWGRRRRRNHAGSCTHTGHPGSRGRAWWQVDLPANYSVQRVSVTNRADCCGDRLNGFDVLIDEVACASSQQINTGESKVVSCNAQGQHLKILGRQGNFLTICEVKVYGSAQADYVHIHAGRCVTGYLSRLSKASVSECASACADVAPDCYYFSYSLASDWDGHNCALYSPSSGCPMDDLNPTWNSYYLVGAQAMPSGTSHLLVYSAYNTTEMATPAALQIVDFYPPNTIPISVNFTDEDNTLGAVSGVVLVTPPSSEGTLTEYRVYWGSSPSQKIEAGQPGLLAEFFCFEQGSRIPSLSGRTPCLTRVDDEVNYQNTNSYWPSFTSRDEFAARWIGFLRIQEEGHYVFYINSDDGSRLYIDDAQVVDNDGLHAMRRASGTKYLSAGLHSLRLLFFENRGSAGMILEYRGADTSNARIVIPHSALLHGSLDNTVGSVPVDGSGLARPVQLASTQIPDTATHLLAFSVGPTGESVECASVAIVDQAVPLHPAGSVSFTDENVTRNVIGGNISVERASDESDVTHYNLYFGTNATAKLQETPLASLAPGTGSGSTVGGCGRKGPDNTPFSSGSGRGWRKDPKVINGQSATECEWKWQVHLASTSNGYTFCAGTLISPRWVLTSAVCTRNRGTSFRVVAGKCNRLQSSAHAQTRMVEAVTPHPSFSSTTMDYDYSLVKLSSEFVMNDCIAPACLPFAQTGGGEECVVTGWGRTSTSSGWVSTLQEAKVVTLTNEACSARVSNPPITAQMMCAHGTSSMGSGTCQGDGGGPLVCMGAGGNYELQGVTSWGDGCANNRFPGVYARVSEVLPWIESTTGLTPPTDTRMHHTINLAMPQGATHILVFTSYNGGEMVTPVATELVDYYPPSAPPAGVTFIDMDATEGELSGIITVQRAVDESGVDAYKLYWSVDGTEKGTLIGQVLPSAAAAVLTLAANTPLPSGVTHILAFSSSHNGDSLESASVAVVDLDKSLVSGGLSFVDIDEARLQVAGMLTIQRALEEQTLTRYNIYWGEETTGCTALGPSIASVPVEVQLADPECTDGGACTAGLIEISLIGANTWAVSRGEDCHCYTDNERATILLSGPGIVSFKRMSTESGYDILEFNQQSYSGEAVPDDIAIDEGPQQVIWYSDGSVSMEGWAFEFTKTVTATSLYQALPAGTSMPSTATHLLVYSQLVDGSEDVLCAREAISDFAPPSGVPQNISFSDIDAQLGRIGGTISIDRARDEFSILSYKVWWGVGDQMLQGDKPMLIVEINTTGAPVVLNTTLAEGTVIPEGATHLVAFCAGEFGQTQEGASVLLWDYAPPTSPAQAVTFTDTDPRPGWLGGHVFIVLAADDTGITTYNLYWASGFQSLDLIAPARPLWDSSPVCSSPSGTDCSYISITEKSSGIWEISRGTATYRPGEEAFVSFDGPGVLSFTVFNTETNHDTLEILGTPYSGTELPPNTAVPPGSHSIKWVTDFDNEGVGWICTLSYSTTQSLEVSVVPSVPPAEATHILVLTAGAGGEMLTGITTALQDYVPPVETAERVDFEDIDLGIGTVGGKITITRASTARDVNVTQFQAFWGTSSDALSQALPEAINVSDQSASQFVLALENGTALPGNATHLLVFAASPHGRAQTSASTRIIDVEGLGFSPSEITLTGRMGEVTTVDVVITNEHIEPVTVNMQINFEGSGADLSREQSTSAASSTSGGRASSSRCNAVKATYSHGDSTSRVLFKWKSHVSDHGRRLHERRLDSSHGLVNFHIYDKLDMQYAEISHEDDSNASTVLLEDLLRMPEVEWAEKDSLVYPTGSPELLQARFQSSQKKMTGTSAQAHMMRKVNPRSHGDVAPKSTYTPSDTFIADQWAFNQANDADIDAPEAWAVHTGDGRHITVAVIDSGVDYNHVDLVGQMWTNPGEIPGNEIDDDQNGLIDDYHGYNYKDGPTNVDPLDDFGHGTHIAGILGAEADNGIGIAGVSWGVQIMALKFLDRTGGSLSNAIRCLDYALSQGAQISVNSWGSASYSRALEDAIVRAKDQGHLFVTSAGNGDDSGPYNIDARPWYPCSYDLDNIVCVAGSDQNDDLAQSTNWGPITVHLAAPGDNIYSTFFNNQYATLSGSSMAAPFVAGTAALVWDYVPTLTYTDVKDVILQTGDDIPKLAGFVVTGKRLNMYKALQGARSLQWARIQGANSSVLVPAQSSAFGIGEARITVELGGERMVAGEYHASLKLWVGVLEQHIPIVLLLHNFSGVPELGAQAVAFMDVSSENGRISGAVTITRAAPSVEEQISQYHIYWGNSSNQTIDGLPALATLDSGSVFRDEFVTADTTFWHLASGAGVSFYSGHVRFLGIFEAAQLSFARRVAAPFTLKARIKRETAFAGMVIQIGGSNVRLFRPGGGIQAVVAGNYKYLDVPGAPRQTVQCLGRLWYEVTITMGIDSVSFADDQDCETLVAGHSLEGPQHLVIGADCTGTCPGSDWDFVEISGGAYAVYNLESTFVPAAATHLLVYAWNPVGLQASAVSCLINDLRSAVRADTPSNASAHDATIDSLMVVWQRGSDNECTFRGWGVTARAAGATTWSTPDGCQTLIDRTVTSCTATGLSSNTGYLFKVQVLCDKSEADSLVSPASLAVKTLPQPALAPTWVAASAPTSSSVRVTWRTGVLNDCEFSESVVEAQTPTNATGWFPPAGCNTLTSMIDKTCVATGLIPTTGYEFRVYTACSDSNANSPVSVPSDSMATTP